MARKDMDLVISREGVVTLPSKAQVPKDEKKQNVWIRDLARVIMKNAPGKDHLSLTVGGKKWYTKAMDALDEIVDQLYEHYSLKKPTQPTFVVEQIGYGCSVSCLGASAVAT